MAWYKTFGAFVQYFYSFLQSFYFWYISADIYDEVSGSISGLGLDTECLGGGRIEHFPESKLLKVYGHSTVSSLVLQYILFSGGVITID